MTSRKQLEREITAALTQRPAFASRRSPALEWHSIGSEGDPWPAWLQAHKKACGVYAIKSSGTVVYVGSSRRRLYDTVTRHMQQWRRNKKWWSGAYGAGHDPGMTYQRGRCEVAVQLVPCDRVLEVEAAWIEKLHPRDNLVEHPDGLEPAPF